MLLIEEKTSTLIDWMNKMCIRTHTKICFKRADCFEFDSYSFLLKPISYKQRQRIHLHIKINIWNFNGKL